MAVGFTSIRGVFCLLMLNFVCGDYLDDVCLKDVDEGTPCEKGSANETSIQTAFSFATEQCVHFNYTGCGGNKNRFRKMDSCLTACTVAYWQRRNKKKPSTHHVDINKLKTQDPSDCRQPKDEGRCLAKKDFWYFDSASAKCQLFSFNGCNGNRNRFQTESICQKVCIKKETYYISE